MAGAQQLRHGRSSVGLLDRQLQRATDEGVTEDDPTQAAKRRPSRAHGRTSLLLTDAATLAATGVVLRSWFPFHDAPTAAMSTGVLALVVGLGWLLVATTRHLYDPPLVDTPLAPLSGVAGCGVILLAAIAVLAFVADARFSTRFATVDVAATTSAVLAVRTVAAGRRRRGTTSSSSRVLVAGTRAEVSDLLQHLERNPSVGLELVGACLPSGLPADVEPILSLDHALPVVGTPGDAAAAAIRADADLILVAGTEAVSGSDLRRLSWQLEHTGIRLAVAPAIGEVAGRRLVVRSAPGLPIVELRPRVLGGPTRVVKAVVDRVGAGLLGLIVLPLAVGVGIAIRLTSPGPALYRQRRIGHQGKEFTLFKFRTMEATADERRAMLLDLNEHDGPLFKIRDDPRITRIGRWLRKYSIDEVPQLLNVIKGEMSLVGPRPALPHEVDRYADDVRRRLLVTPGLTGLWQVSGRADLPWEECVRLDLHYVDNWSLTFDALLLARTLRAVVGGRGAY